jgi:hypothetical protein
MMAISNINFYPELGRLLVFIADTATAIRLNSAYSDYQYIDRKESPFDVMWLSDSLHLLNYLGVALQSGDTNKIISACDSLIDKYHKYTDESKQVDWKSKPKDCFDKWKNLCRLDLAIEAFTEIRNKALVANDGYL